MNVMANQSNNFSFTLHGIVEAFDTEPQYIGVPASPSPSASPLTTTFHALDGDFYLIDAVDASTSFFTGSQPSGPFSAASFPVTANDENTCATAPCVSLASPAPAIADPTTEGIAFAYNGGGASGDGSTANPPYYGLIGATGPSGYAGNVSATVGETAYAATAYVVPFFAIVDQSTKNAAATDASDVSFTTPSDSVNVLARAVPFADERDRLHDRCIDVRFDRIGEFGNGSRFRVRRIVYTDAGVAERHLRRNLERWRRRRGHDQRLEYGCGRGQSHRSVRLPDERPRTRATAADANPIWLILAVSRPCSKLRCSSMATRTGIRATTSS